MRRTREAQQAAYQVSRAVLDRAAQRRDAEWRAAADANLHRSLWLLGLPLVPAVVLLALGAVVPALLVVGAVIGLAWAAIAILSWRQAGIAPLKHALDPDQAAVSGVLPPAAAARLEDVTESLCAALGLPPPKLRVVSDPSLNAGSFGRGPSDAVVVLTTGSLQSLHRIELEAVLAHEMSHVKRRDILTSGLAGTAACRLAGALTGGRASRWLVGQDREIWADLAAVGVTRYPPGLIDALGAAGPEPDSPAGERANAAGLSPRSGRAFWFMGAGPSEVNERLAVLQEL